MHAFQGDAGSLPAYEYMIKGSSGDLYTRTNNFRWVLIRTIEDLKTFTGGQLHLRAYFTFGSTSDISLDLSEFTVDNADILSGVKFDVGNPKLPKIRDLSVRAGVTFHSSTGRTMPSVTLLRNYSDKPFEGRYFPSLNEYVHGVRTNVIPVSESITKVRYVIMDISDARECMRNMPKLKFISSSEFPDMFQRYDDVHYEFIREIMYHPRLEGIGVSILVKGGKPYSLQHHLLCPVSGLPDKPITLLAHAVERTFYYKLRVPYACLLHVFSSNIIRNIYGLGQHGPFNE